MDGGSLLRMLLDIALVFCPVIGYVGQYFRIVAEKSSEGYSLLPSFVLIFSNTLRCFFWLGKHFELPLLFQAIVMVVAQFWLLRVCTHFPSKSQRGHSFFDLEVSYFWHWEDFPSYLFFQLFTVTAMWMITYIMQDFPQVPFFEFLGYAALIIESTLAIPQLISNHRRKSTAGLSGFLVACWCGGDGLKTIYFLATGAPAQFLMCGVMQIIVDVAIVLQLFSYPRTPHGAGPVLPSRI
eukprot:TRINITY_DN80224_c0_g1_i1.p1 TRINITY_DN80224_c0_g1~~TRINITY_DN80224_c0_g1_i1.p1  ORF type:complete len:238 (-),score=19.79 TRINITY_DN80224_c0_g1_i1:9-722(-)